MSGTVVRIKRRFDEDPIDTLVLSYKRRRTCDGLEDASTKILTFAATVVDKNLDGVRKILANSKTMDELKESYKKHVPDIASKKRKDCENKHKENRFKILSCRRATESTATDSEQDDHVVPITILLDVGIEEEDGAGRLEKQYVYDLYSTDFMPEEADIDDGYLESLVRIEPFRSPMDYRGSEDSEEFDPYEEDSNDESNWRNDYPDSDHSVNEDDMRLAASLYGMGIDDGGDLSSDSDDERYLEESGSSPPKGFDAFKRRIIQQEKRANFIDVIESEGSSDGSVEESHEDADSDAD